MHWRLYYQPVATDALKDQIERYYIFGISFRFVDSPTPHIVFWDGNEESASYVADILIARNYDVITMQRESGPP